MLLSSGGEREHYGYIAAIKDRGPRQIGSDASSYIEASVGHLTCGSGTNGTRAETSTRSIAHSSVERSTNNANIKWLKRRR